MNEYIDRLERSGMSRHDATRLARAMVRDYGYKALEELTAEREKEAYVERIQP